MISLDNSGFDFFKHDGRRYAWVATIIDFGIGFSFCCIGTNGFFTKKLNKKKELVWVDRKGNPVTDDEEGQIDVITKYGNISVIPFSATKGDGVDEVRRHIENAVENKGDM